MNRAHPLPDARAPGFSLIELVIIIVVMAIASTGIIALQQGIFSGQSDNAQIQAGSALMQECAELILAKRQKDGFANIPTGDASSLCSGATFTTAAGTTYAAPTVTVDEGNSVTLGTSGCPYSTDGSKDCKLVTIQQVKPDITLLLAK